VHFHIPHPTARSTRDRRRTAGKIGRRATAGRRRGGRPRLWPNAALPPRRGPERRERVTQRRPSPLLGTCEVRLWPVHKFPPRVVGSGVGAGQRAAGKAHSGARTRCPTLTSSPRPSHSCKHRRPRTCHRRPRRDVSRGTVALLVCVRQMKSRTSSPGDRAGVGSACELQPRLRPAAYVGVF
jgi:hypothetical protein